MKSLTMPPQLSAPLTVPLSLISLSVLECYLLRVKESLSHAKSVSFWTLINIFRLASPLFSHGRPPAPVYAYTRHTHTHAIRTHTPYAHTRHTLTHSIRIHTPYAYHYRLHKRFTVFKAGIMLLHSPQTGK